MKTLILALTVLVSLNAHATLSKSAMHNLDLAASITATDVEGDRYSTTYETLESESLDQEYRSSVSANLCTSDCDSVTPYDNEGGD